MLRRYAVAIAIVCCLLGASLSGLAATRELAVQVDAETGTAVPVNWTLDELRRAFGLTFRADWNTLAAFDENGDPLPVQIDDIDGDGAFSRDDVVSVLATGNFTLTAATSGDAPVFPDRFTITTDDDGDVLVETVDGAMAVKIDAMGVVEVAKFDGVPSLYVKDIGVLRYAGYPRSTYWVDGDLKNHEEKTTYEEPQRVYDLRIFPDSPVRATVVVERASDLFPGLVQKQVIAIYPTGDIVVDTTVESRGYADLTKLLVISSAYMAGASDAQHVLPVFRWLEWADELETTPADYWSERDALIEVDGGQYVAFSGAGPVPFWWGASYIFASPERWRTNYSAQKGIGAAELLFDVPEVEDDLIERLSAPQWQLEGEWRYGFFRWIPEEVVAKRAERGIELDLETDMEAGNWALHMIPGDTFTVRHAYTVYRASDVESAVRYLEGRHGEMTSARFE